MSHTPGLDVCSTMRIYCNNTFTASLTLPFGHSDVQLTNHMYIASILALNTRHPPSIHAILLLTLKGTVHVQVYDETHKFS